MGVNALDIKLVELCRILSFEPQTLDEITDKMHEKFKGNDRAKLKNEIESFLAGLIDDGVIEEINR
jgi:hypothetical protein